MSQVACKPPIGYAEYLVFEESSETKHEFWNGEIFAMSGGSFAHALIAGNIARHSGIQLAKKPCRVYPSDTRIRPEHTDNAAYPDVSVFCGAPLAHPNDKNAATNPKVIVEVLSDSTERFDRGDSSVTTAKSYLLRATCWLHNTDSG